MHGHDGLYEYWFKKFISINNRLAIEMNRYLQEIDESEWMTTMKWLYLLGSNLRDK